MMRSMEITLQNKLGLHARPATLFVKEAARHASKIQVENLSNPTRVVNARSLLMILSLGVEPGHTIRISAEGPDEVEALEAIRSLIQGNFGEA